MDYHRIYREFIKDRREREPGLSGYTERHHILPRSLGGGDEPENLIRLTAEDHFFAHLLLAKMHGGKLWSPVAFMVGGSRKDYRPVLSRKGYGWVKAALAKSKTREGAHQFDRRIHHLRHKDGRVWSGYQADMGVIGLSKAGACNLVSGKFKSSKGWHLADSPQPDRGGKNHPMYRRKVHHFVHMDGRRFRGTQHQLHVTHGVSKSMACRLATGQFATANGWFLEGTSLPKTGRGAAVWRKRLNDGESRAISG